MATTPIWQDTAVTIPHGDLFRILGGQDEFGNSGEFFRGVAVSPSGVGNATVYVNRICAARMLYGIPNFKTRTAASIGTPQSFTIQRSTDGGATWTTVSTPSFRPDWSYLVNASTVRNVPITDHFHPRMTIFFSVLEYTTNNINGWYDIGNGHVNTAYAGMSGSKTVAYPISLIGASPIKAVGLGTVTYSTPNYCAPGALYYRNALGGWDAFLVEGSIVKATGAERYTRKVAVLNTVATNRGEQNYVSELTPRWTLRTGELTDAESARMWHLLESTDVYLHTFDDDAIVPVVLDDSSQEEKKFRTSGRRCVTYTINCHLAQERIRQ